MQTEQYLLPLHWAPVLLNGDTGSCSPEEASTIHKWLALVHPGRAVDVGPGESLCRYHDANNVTADAAVCATFTFAQ